MNPDTDHRAAIDYRYRFEGPAAQKLEHLTTAELVTRIDASEALDSRRPMDWPAYRVIADRSGIAHEFEREYGEELEARYSAVRALVPDADPRETGGAFDAAYGAYSDEHPILTPTARALAWARENAAVPA